MIDVSIVILNYKQKGLVKQCIKGIVASRPSIGYEIIVVDNNSGDGVLQAVQDLFKTAAGSQGTATLFDRLQVPRPEIITIQAGENRGFAVGNNLGIQRSRGRYVVVMNPDIAIVPGALEHLVEFMDQQPQVGICGPKLINPDGSVQYSCRRFPTLFVPLYRRTFFGSFKHGQQMLTDYLMRDFNHATNLPVDWLFGACLVIRRSLIDKIGLFDERFFMYFEDLDWCRRCWAAGFQVYYVAAVELVHYHQRLSAERSGLFGLFSKAGRIHLASGIKYFAKYLGVAVPKRLR